MGPQIFSSVCYWDPEEVLPMDVKNFKLMIDSAAAGNDQQQQDAASAIIAVQVRSSAKHREALLEAADVRINKRIFSGIHYPLNDEQGLAWCIEVVLKHASFPEA